MRNNVEIVERILASFPKHYIIEVHVNDGSGDPFEVYVGIVQGILPTHFDNVFREPGCFYSFTVVGILEELTNAVDVHHSNIKRSEFLWLTDASPPQLLYCDSKTATIGWEEVTSCGFSIQGGDALPSCVEYILEMAEGCEWKEGKISTFVTDLTVESYRPLYRCNGGPLKMTIRDLLPGVRYFARVVMEYLGHRVVSAALCFHTDTCEPSAPGMPRAHVAPFASKIDPSSEPAPNILLNWSASSANGSDIIKYQVLMQEVKLARHYVPNELFSPLFAQPKKGQSDRRVLKGGKWVTLHPSKPEKTGPIAPIEPFYHDNELVISKWTRIYSNLERKVKLRPPPVGSVEWKFRVRAKNADGWSEYSPVLSIHNRSHPALFAAEYPVGYRGGALAQCSYSPNSPEPIPYPHTPAFRASAPPLQDLQPGYGQQYDDQYDRLDESDLSFDFAERQSLRRPRATSALPSTSHDRRESFSSEMGGISAPNSRIMNPDDGLVDGGSGILSGIDRSGISSRGRSAGARLSTQV